MVRRVARYVSLPPPVLRIYEAVAELEQTYPGRKFTPDGHMVGSIGEVVAAEAFGLILLPMSEPLHDARSADGRLVQVKMTAGNVVAFYGDCEHLIVLRVDTCRTRAEVIYDGPGAPAVKSAGPVQKNGQRVIRISKLRKLACEYADRTAILEDVRECPQEK